MFRVFWVSSFFGLEFSRAEDLGFLGFRGFWDSGFKVRF